MRLSLIWHTFLVCSCPGILKEADEPKHKAREIVKMKSMGLKEQASYYIYVLTLELFLKKN